MSEPVKLGDALDPRIAAGPVLIPKHCPQCGKDYDGMSFTGLRPGETRANATCGDCLQRLEDAARAREQGFHLTDDGEVLPLSPPRRVGDG